MALPLRTATILQYLGYTTREFDVIRSKGVVSIVWRIPDPGVTEQQVIDAELPTMKAKAKQAIKAEAGRRIIAAHGDETKQRNMLALMGELLERKFDGVATQGELDQLAALKAVWAGVQAKRSASDDMEAEVDTLTDPDDCEAYIAGIQADTASAPRTVEWP